MKCSSTLAQEGMDLETDGALECRLLHIAVWGHRGWGGGQLLERDGSGWDTRGGRENQVCLNREFCGTDHITPFQGMGDLLIACIPGFQKNSAKQWGPADFGAGESTYRAGPGFLSPQGQSPQAVLCLPGPLCATPFWLSLSSCLQLCQQNTHSPLDLSSVSRRKQPD